MSNTWVTGGQDDAVRLQLNGDEIFIAEGWEVLESVLATPACFSLDLGQSLPLAQYFTAPAFPLTDTTGGGLNPHAAKYPQGVPFKLYIGDALQMSGIYEGFHASGIATRIHLKGRDALSGLLRAHPEEQRSFKDGTYAELVEWALAEAGYPNAILGRRNGANAQMKAGIPIDIIDTPLTADEIAAHGTAAADGAGAKAVLVGGVTSQQHSNRIHENLLAFVRRHLDRAGLCLWAGCLPNTFILGQPNGSQKPALQIVRRRGATMSASNVIDLSFQHDFAGRHSSATIYGKGGGRGAGRTKAITAVPDEEMTNYGMAYGAGWQGQGICYRDVNCQSLEQAEFYARRKLAEERRNGWNLTYTISGHRLPSATTPGLWGVVTPDTCVRIIDDWIGLNGIYYVESVRRLRKPETLTEIRFMRVNDLIFGTGGID